jgi:hypothetical protein
MFYVASTRFCGPASCKNRGLVLLHVENRLQYRFAMFRVRIYNLSLLTDPNFFVFAYHVVFIIDMFVVQY